MKTQIKYKNGDATAPISPKSKIIVHICNDIGGWGRGFVLAVSKRWAEPEKKYKEWFASKEGFALGEIQFVQVEPDLWVANLIGQHTIYKDKDGNPPIRYEAVLSGLEKLTQFALKNEAEVFMPRIGCGLAGGTWDKIEPLIASTLLENEVEVTVYDF